MPRSGNILPAGRDFSRGSFTFPEYAQISRTLSQPAQLVRRLLIYQIKEDVLVLELTRTGTHADLF